MTRRLPIHKKREPAVVPDGYAILRMTFKGRTVWRIEKDGTPVCDRLSKIEAIAHVYEHAGLRKPWEPEPEDLSPEILAVLRGHRSAAQGVKP